MLVAVHSAQESILAVRPIERTQEVSYCSGSGPSTPSKNGLVGGGNRI